MDQPLSALTGLDDILRSGSSEKRLETLRRVTDLFLSNANRLGADHVALFDDVLVQLIGHIESKALAELGGRLAPLDNAPIEIIRRLAMHDEIDVAGPVLSKSSRLTGADLVKIAGTKSQDHLLAISGRASIEEQVTDVLVERGNEVVARKIASNAGARFSGDGFAALVRRAERDDTLACEIGRRRDIPPLMFQQLIATATETVKARLLAAADQDAAST